jgi:hypothetical protein
MSDKEQAHALIERLDPSQVAAVVHLLEAFLDEDGDTLSPAEAIAIAEADAWSKTHAAIPNEQVLAEFGLTAADWEKMGRGD